ncbi:TOMM precursor leader peptide-binding protein [Streptomyces sp. NPDC101150]|uniref:TOMM precursor leader peptide-binding protein n=1 Tax=Streptomyces sp. NPDC101150 TaxID=3366114 RepID=UPI003803C75A
MTTAYEAISGTRPKIRRDILFAKMPDGVLFHNSKEGFHIRSAKGYEFASLLVPHLNGERQISEICAELDASRRAMVAELVAALLSHGFARDAAPAAPQALPPAAAVRSAFAEQIGYIDHHVDDAEARFARFRDTRVAVLGDDAIARWCALSLVRNGAAQVAVTVAEGDRLTGDDRFTEVVAEAEELTARGCTVAVRRLPAPSAPLTWHDLEDYDVVVVCPEGGGPRQILELLASGPPEGRALLPASMVGDRVMTGPLTTDGATACWACAALRLGANEDSGESAELWRRASLPGQDRPSVRPPRPVAAMVGNMLGYEIFRLRTGALAAETDGAVVVQELDSLDVTTERVLPHPGCPFCTRRIPGTASEGVDEDVTEDVTEDVNEGLDEGVDEDAGTDATTAVPAPVTAEDEARLLGELKDRSVLVGRVAGVFTEFTDDALKQSPLKATLLRLGLGPRQRRTVAAFDPHTVLGARLRALHQAAVLYADQVVPLPEVTTDADLPRSAPDSLVTASGTHGPDAPVTGWVVATSLLTKERALVPAGAVDTFGPHNDDRVWLPGAPGTGAGATLGRAAYRGLLSVLAHEAVDQALRGRRTVTRLALEEPYGIPELTFLTRCARNLGLPLELLDLGEAGHSSAHVVLARATGLAPYAVACEPDAAAAAVRAAADLLGRVQLSQDPAAADALAGEPFDAFDAAALTVTAESALALAPPTARRTVLDRLRDRGSGVFVVPRTSDDLLRAGVATARVLLTHPR